MVNSKYYRKLEEDPTQEFATQVIDLVSERANEGHINEDTKEYLTPSNPRNALFYHLTKIHKPTAQGRPIVSSSRAPTERISELVDYHLHPLVVQTPMYFRDKTDFLVKLSHLGHISPGYILVRLNVKSPYTNIPHDKGLEANRLALETHSSQHPPTVFLTRMMEQMTLSLNNFTFDEEH